MRSILRPMTSVLSVINRIALWMAGIGLVGMTAIVAWQVFGRYVLGSTPRYAEATAIMLMAWFIFLGAAVGVRERYHLGFDVLLYFVSYRTKQILRTISDIVVFAFGAGMAFYGGQLVAHSWGVAIPTLGLPGGMTYVPLTLGGVLICLFTIERLLQRLLGLNPDEDALDAPTPLNNEQGAS